MMATPFVPVPVPMERTQSENCRSWPKRTSPLGSLSSSSASFPTAKSPWVRATGSLGATVVCPSLPQPCSSPEVCRRPREAEKSLVLEDGTPRDILEERPLTPILLGYEVMEERAKFTVYKILVRRSQDQEDSWVIFRRYTDFSRLNDKLKEMFPRFRLALPPKRWFKDNYDMEFLEERQLGLQAFLQNLIAHKDITNSEAVRQFLCLDDPPGPFDSLEESRAFCETLEETNHRLQRELNEKQREIESLKRVLKERHIHIGVLEKRAKNGEYLSPESFESPCRISAMGSESCADTQTTTEGQRDMDGEADVHTDQETSPERSCEVQRLLQGHGAYWCTPPVNGSPDLS